MPDSYSTRQTASAANISRLRLDQWVSRGYVTPSHTPQPGEARQYSLTDVITVATLAELVRLGINPATAAPWAFRIRGFRDDQAVLVVWQGPGELIPCSNPGDPPACVLRTEGGWTRLNPGTSIFYDPDSPPYHAEIVRPRELPEMVRDPDKRSFAIVNLDHVEQRVLAALDKTGAEGLA